MTNLPRHLITLTSGPYRSFYYLGRYKNIEIDGLIRSFVH